MENEYLQGAGVANSDLLLRQIAYTSFDQPQFIQHWRSAPLSSDLDELGTVEAAWNQVCTIQYYFGAGLQRLISVKYKGLLKTQTLSLGGFEIRETTRGAAADLVKKEERSSFGNGSRVKRWTATNPVVPIIAYEYSVSDHLGSDSVTYDGQGQVQNQRGHLKEGETQKTERQSYDAWGARRDGESWAPAKGQLGAGVANSEEREGSNLARGYTGHEMLDDVGLIHMNGRLYDPALGRMCAADPYVQTPENIQNYNRYSYVLNNPLSQIDPSGHFIIGIIAAVVGAIIGIVGAVIATVVAFVAYLAALAAQFVVMVVGAVGKALGAMGSALLSAAKAGIAGLSANLSLGGVAFGKVYLGAALGAVYNGAQAAINGGSFSDILKAAALGAVTGAVGAVTGGFLHGFGGAIGGALTEAGMSKAGAFVAGKVIHAAAHGVVGGAMSAAQGGNFKDGFIGSLIGAGVSAVTGAAFPGIERIDGATGVLVRTAIASLSGGAASALAGGKFADGAYSAAFFHLFNHEAGNWSLKGIQKGLRLFGKIPVIGDIADGVNVGISLATGDFAGAARNAAAMVPGLGTALDIYDAGNAIVEYATKPTPAQVTENYNQGKAAEARAVADLKAQGYTSIERGVRVTDAAGNIRYPDIIATSPGGVMEAFEVKSGNAPYKRPQSSFDLNLETNGGTSKLWKGVQTIGTKLLRY